MDPIQETFYDLIGGQATIDQIVDHFYPKVARHPDLIPIFPEDLTETMEKQRRFLAQFLGGPPLYSEIYGPPMMRHRHLPHEITPTRARAWLSCMREALSEVDMRDDLREFLFDRLTQVAFHMVNTPEEE